MGCGASVARPTANSTKSLNPAGQQTMAKTQTHEGLIQLYFFCFFQCLLVLLIKYLNKFI
jgi:hypothetical protein